MGYVKKCRYCDTTKGALKQDGRGRWECRSELACFNRLLKQDERLRAAGHRLRHWAAQIAKHPGDTVKVPIMTATEAARVVREWDTVVRGGAE